MTAKDLHGDSSSASKLCKDVESTVIRLLGLLLQSAEYVATDNLQEASSLLLEISEVSSPYASSPERVVAYFAQALQARVISSCLCAYTPFTAGRSLTMAQSQKIFAALQSYNSVSPLIKFSHFTANQAIFEAVEGEDRVHIIDLDVMQGLQWPALFHILASRTRKLRSLRITGFGSSADLLASTGRRLADFAASLDLPFEFNAVEGKIGELREVGIRREETVVVHWMQHRLYDVTGSEAGAVEVLRRMKPRLVTVVEQDVRDGGERRFMGRFVEALHYYSALFDALGEGMEEENAERYRVEEELFGREIRNIVMGEEGGWRWWEELSRVGFRPVSLKGNPATQAGLLLGMMPWKGYTLVQQRDGTLRLGWKHISLLTASAWLSPPSLL